MGDVEKWIDDTGDIILAVADGYLDADALTGERAGQALAALKAVLDQHHPVNVEPSDTICHECSFQLPNGRYFGKVLEWPCPTVRAITDALGGDGHE